MAVIIADKGKVAVDLSKAFKIMLLPANKELGVYYPFLNREGWCWKECLPLNEDTDGEALLSYLVQAKESDVILVWEDLLKNFRKSERRREEEVQLREEVERLRSEVKRLRNECSLLMSDFDALKRRLADDEGDEDDEDDEDKLIPVAVDDDWR